MATAAPGSASGPSESKEHRAGIKQTDIAPSALRSELTLKASALSNLAGKLEAKSQDFEI